MFFFCLTSKPLSIVIITVIIARLYPPARHLLFVCVKCLRVLPGALRQRLYNCRRLRSYNIAASQQPKACRAETGRKKLRLVKKPQLQQYCLLKIYFFSQHLQYLIQQINAAVAFLPFDTAVIIDRHITAFGHVVLGQPQLQPQLV